MRRLASRLRKTIWRYLKAYYSLVRFSVVEVLTFRTNALIIGLAPIVWLATMLILINVIFSQVKELAGWNFWEVVFLTGVHEVVFLLCWSTFLTNLRKTIDSIKNGRFDQILLRPINPRFLTSFQSLDFTAVGSIFNALAIFLISFRKLSLEVSPIKLLVFLIMLFCSYWIAYFTYFIAASLSLFFIDSRSVMDCVLEATDFDRYPAGIYPPRLRDFLTFGIPILFFTFIPTAVFLNKLEEVYLLYAWFVFAALYFISHLIFKWGLRNYQSASS